MWSRLEFIKFIAEHERRLITALYEGFKPDAPEPPARPEPEPRKLRQSEQPGIDMNDMLRSCPRPRPPRRPGQQSKRSNGYWSYWE
jgi:hypothetical protein